MKKNGRLNLAPNNPKVVTAVLERLRAMSPEELLEMLNHRSEGVEETDMNEELAAWYRDQQAGKTDIPASRIKVA